jgi:hypothetical protein
MYRPPESDPSVLKPEYEFGGQHGWRVSHADPPPIFDLIDVARVRLSQPVGLGVRLICWNRPSGRYALRLVGRQRVRVHLGEAAAGRDQRQ